MANQVRQTDSGHTSLQRTNFLPESNINTLSEGIDDGHGSSLKSGSAPTVSNATGADEGENRNTPDKDSRRPQPLLRSSPPRQTQDAQMSAPQIAQTSRTASSGASIMQGMRQNVIAGSNGSVITANWISMPTIVFPELYGVDPARHRRLPALPTTPPTANADSPRSKPATTPRSTARGLGDIVKQGPPPPQDAPPTTPRSSTRPALSGMPSSPGSPGSSKLPSTMPGDDGALSFRQMLGASAPPFGTELSLASGKSGAAIKEIAKRIVAAELADGLNAKTLGRLSPKIDGASVYSDLGSYANGALAKSDLAGIVAKCKQRLLRKYGDNPDKLVSVTGSDSDATGQHTSANLKALTRYLNPVFEFVCGTRQQFGDSKLPGTLLSLFKAIDQELVKALLARRRDQLAAEKLFPLEKRAANADHALDATQASAARQLLDAELKKSGWTGAYFKKLLEETVFSAKVIQDARINMFTGMLFTRCVTPYILFDSDEPQLESTKGNTVPHKVFQQLATCANKLFKKDYRDFVEDFIRVSHSVLPEEAAGMLAKISLGEERFLKTKKSQKFSPDSATKSQKFRARQSAPQLPQGDDFQALMKQEKTSAEAETPARQKPAAPADRKLRIKAAVDRFKGDYPQAFGDEEFAIAFHLKYKQWQKSNALVQPADLPPALEKIFRQVKNELEGEAGRREREDALREERRATKVRPQPQGHGGSSSLASASGGTTVIAAEKSPSGLSTEQTASLNKFLMRTERRAALERYPDLRRQIEAGATEWHEKHEGKNLVLALQNIFETALIQSVHRSYLSFEAAPEVTPEAFIKKAADWKTNNPLARLTLENLETILPGAVLVHGPNPVRNSAIRTGELQTETLLREPEVIARFRASPLMKKAFLHDVRQWLLSGAYSQPGENHVHRIYQEVVLVAYIRISRLMETSEFDLTEVKDLAEDWCAEHPDAFLTTELLDKLFKDLLGKRAQEDANS